MLAASRQGRLNRGNSCASLLLMPRSTRFFTRHRVLAPRFFETYNCSSLVPHEPRAARGAHDSTVLHAHGSPPLTTCKATLIMGDVVDLTLSDSEEETPAGSPLAAARPPAPAAVDEEQQQRKRIMDFAKHKAANIGAKRAKPGSMTSPDEKSEGSISAKAAASCADASTADEAAGSPAAAKAEPALAGQTSGISNADLRALHEARMRRQQQQQTGSVCDAAARPCTSQQDTLRQQAVFSSSATAAAGASEAHGHSLRPAAATTSSNAAAAAGSSSKSISLLTYNVWFKEEVAVLERMTGLGDIVRKADLPTFICLQEMTPRIAGILSRMEWWQEYHCSPVPSGFDATYFTQMLVKKSAAPSLSQSAFDDQPFRNSVMGRSLRSVKTSIAGNPILAVTTHLESPIPPHNFYSKERQQQMAEALRALDASSTGNVLFVGDMNWDENRDGSPPLPSSWRDAWATLHPNESGFTYDAKNNPMLPYKGLALRLDRVLCKLRDWRLDSIELVGTQPLPGVKYTHTFRNGGKKELPVLPSDHFGLLVKLAEV